MYIISTNWVVSAIANVARIEMSWISTVAMKIARG